MGAALAKPGAPLKAYGRGLACGLVLRFCLQPVSLGLKQSSFLEP